MSRRPLDGVRVVVTRTREQSGSLIDALEAEGAEAVPVPVIEITDPPDGGAALRAGLAALGRGDWVVISSPNGAERVGAVLAERPLADGVSVAAIGPGTRARIEAAGLTVDLMPASSIAEGLLDALPDPPPGGGTMLLARAETARAVLPDGLRARGWTVRDLPAYRTVPAPVSASDAVRCRHSDVAAFTSASTVRHLTAGVGVDGLPPVRACIGPATAAEAAALGVEVDLVAHEHTIPGLVAALVDAVPAMVLFRPEPSPPDGPDGFSVTGRQAGEAVAVGVVEGVGDGRAELVELRVDDRRSDTAIGSSLVRRIVAEARALGLRRLHVDLGRVSGEAVAWCVAEGFVAAPSGLADAPSGGPFVLEIG
jgi:uroporphyrinogen-III synthase